MVTIKTIVIAPIVTVGLLVSLLTEISAGKILWNEEGELGSGDSQSGDTVSATFIGRFVRSDYCTGITKVEDKIYILSNYPHTIKVYDDQIGFRFIKDIVLIGIGHPHDIVYSKESKCVYISDFGAESIWRMTTTGEHRLTKWLTNVNYPYTLTLSNEGHLMVLKERTNYLISGQDSLEIYSLKNATLMRRLTLPLDIQDANRVVQTPTGNFIIEHNMEHTYERILSQVDIDGELVNRYIPRNPTQKLSAFDHMFLDSVNNQLIVADTFNNRMVLLDATDLTWIKVLVSEVVIGIQRPWTFFNDAIKKQLFVAVENQLFIESSYCHVKVFEIK